MKGLFKFLRWILGFRKQYNAQFKSYNKGGLAGKIVTLVLSLGAVGFAIWMELNTFYLFSTHFGWAIVSAVFTVAVIVTLVKTCGIYTVVAFMSAVKAGVDTKIDQAVKKIDEKYEGVSQAVIDCENAIQGNSREKNPRKWFDVMSGFLYLIASAGLLITAIVLLFLKLQMVI